MEKYDTVIVAKWEDWLRDITTAGRAISTEGLGSFHMANKDVVVTLTAKGTENRERVEHLLEYMGCRIAQ